MKRVAILSLCLLFVLACSKNRIDESHWSEKGAAAVLPVKQSLKAALTEAMAKGPVEAVGACQVVAPELTKSASTPEAKVGRTSHKLRNPSNAPKPWMQPLLLAYTANPNEMAPKVVAIDSETIGYMEPIYLQPMCVTCHGTVIAPAVKARIDELYPDDEATGFEPGDFRGVFWVELARD